MDKNIGLMECILREKRKLLVAQIPAGSGVYILWSGPRILYVGQSSGVGSRLLQHLSIPFDRIQVILVKDGTKRRFLENWLILTFCPELNNGRVDQDGLRKAIRNFRLEAYRKQNAGDYKNGYWSGKRHQEHLQAIREIKALPIFL